MGITIRITVNCELVLLVPAASCRDSEETNCPQWASEGECSLNPMFMVDSCQLSCRTCALYGKGYWEKGSGQNVVLTRYQEQGGLIFPF